MNNSDNKNTPQIFQSTEFLTDQEIHASLKEVFWTARTAAYTVLGLKIPNLESLEEEKRFFPDFEQYYNIFEKCFRNGKIAVRCLCSEKGKQFPQLCLWIG